MKKMSSSPGDVSGKSPPATQMMVRATMLGIITRKTLSHQATQCTHEASPIIFMASFSRFSFSSTTARTVLCAVYRYVSTRNVPTVDLAMLRNVVSVHSGCGICLVRVATGGNLSGKGW